MLTRDSRKISIIGGLLLIGVTLTTGLAVYEVMRQQIESSLGRGLDVALQGKAHLLESQIEKGLADTHAVVTRPFLVQTLKQIIDYPSNTHALQDLQRNVDSLKLNEFTAAKVFDLHGNVLSQTGHFSEKETPSLPLIKYHNTFLLWNGEFILHTREDVLDLEHNPIGSIITEKSLPQLTRSFEEIRSIGKTGEFILCAPPEHNSLKMTCLISQIDGVKFQHISRVKDSEMLPMNDALDGKTGVMSVKDYRKISVIEAYAPSSMGLGMILKLDEDELFEPVTDELKVIIFYLTGLILAEILLLNWFVRELIKSEHTAQKAKEKAEQFSIELAHKEFELRSRLKEITCLYDIRRSIEPEASVECLCQQIFNHLIPALQYPESVSIVIDIEDLTFISSDHHLSQLQKLSSEIVINNKAYGHLGIYYPKDQSFLILDEQRLIDAVTIDLGRWLERKQLEKALIVVAEDQAHTIGQELHDNLGQQVAAIGYQARALEKSIAASGNHEMTSIAAAIAKQAQISVIHIKQLAQGLLPFELEANGLTEALQTLAARITTSYTVQCEFSFENTTDIEDHNVALNLYRITQEAANNAIRHGAAQHINILLYMKAGVLYLSIINDGNDFNHENSQGMGIKIMQYRAKQLGATLAILPRNEGGTEVHLEMQAH